MDYTDKIRILLDKIPTDALDQLYERLTAVKGAGVLLAAEMSSGTVTTAEYASVSKELAADQRALLQAIDELESQYAAVAAAQEAARKGAIDLLAEWEAETAALYASKRAAIDAAESQAELAAQLAANTAAFDAYIEAQILADQSQRDAAAAAAQEAEALAAVAAGNASAITGVTEFALADEELTVCTYELVTAMEKSEQQQIAEMNAFRAAQTAIEQKTAAQRKAVDIDNAGTSAATRNQTAIFDAMLKSGHATGDLTDAMAEAGTGADRLSQHVGKGSNLGMAMFALSQGIEDAQYGFHSIINNIPMVVMAIGGFSQTAMVASAGISMVAVAINMLLPKIQEMMKSLQEITPQSAIAGISELEHRAKELRKEFEKSPIKLAVDEAALERLDKRISDLRKNAAAMREKMEGKTEEESDTAKEVEKVFKAPGAKTLIEQIRENRVKKGTLLSAEENEEIDKAKAKAQATQSRLNEVMQPGFTTPSFGVTPTQARSLIEKARKDAKDDTEKANRVVADKIRAAGKAAEERLLAEINKKIESGKDEDIDALINELKTLGTPFGETAAHDLALAKPEARKDAQIVKQAKEISDKELKAREERSRRFAEEWAKKNEEWEKETDAAATAEAKRKHDLEFAFIASALGGGAAAAPTGGIAAAPRNAPPAGGFAAAPSGQGTGFESLIHALYTEDIGIVMRSRSGLDAKEKRLRDKLRKKAGTHMRDADGNLRKVGDPELEAATDELVLAEHDRLNRKAQALAAKRRARHTSKKRQKHTLNPFAARPQSVNRAMTPAEIASINRSFESRRFRGVKSGLQARGVPEADAGRIAAESLKDVGKHVTDSMRAAQIQGLKSDQAFAAAMSQFSKEQQIVASKLVELQRNFEALSRGSRVRQQTLLNMGR